MKIGFFMDCAYPGGYGVEIATETFRKQLEKWGHETYVFVPHDKEVKEVSPFVFRFKSWQVQKNPKLFFSFPWPVGRKFREVINLKLDIIHTQFPLNLGLLAKYVAWRKKIPVICTHHTDFPTWVRANIKERIFLPRLVKWWMKKYSNWMDALIVPSSKVKGMIDNLKIEKPIYVLGNAVDLRLFNKGRRDKGLKEKLGIPAESRVLIFVGRLSQEKNVEFLLRVMAEILKVREDAVLLLVGGGYGMRSLKKMAVDLNIEKNVKFADFVPHQEIAPYYNISDVFVMASLAEMMPLTILEALACGLPAVVLEEAAFYDTITEGVNGFLVKEQEPKVFAKMVLELLSNQTLYHKFSEAASRTGEKFSVDEQTKKLLKIYNEILKSKKYENIYHYSGL